jgi:hypothetical protein
MFRLNQPRVLVSSRFSCGSLLSFSLLAIPLISLGCTGTIGESDLGTAGGTAPTTSGTGSDPGGTVGGGSSPGGVVGGGSAPAPSGACSGDQLGPSPLHRLTRVEYDNSIRDLIGEDMNLSKDFAFDEKAGEFNSNFFNPLTDVQFSQYATAAEAVAERAVTKLSSVVPCDPAGDAAGCGKQFIKQFGRNAFRRPLEDTEVARYAGLFEQGRTGLDFANGVRLVVQAMLQSPKFIYLVEGPGPLTQHQLAARLSYFLWNAPPDAQLAAAADSGTLGSVDGLRKEAARLINDKRGSDMIVDFHNQWLGYWAWEMGKDVNVYPQFAALQPSLIEETNRFLLDAIKKDGARLDTLFTSNTTFVNGPLAAVYGVSAPGGTDWAPATLDSNQRAGLFTQASFLSAHGAYDGSSPIRRGLAIRERILCAEMPVPPPGADATFPAAKPTQTTRQRFDQHRTDPSCASCHMLMDKIGYGFESYDGIGRFRTTENNVPIDDTGELYSTDIDGPFKGSGELIRKLLSSKQVQSCVTTQWFRYAFGRLNLDTDKCTLEAFTKSFTDGDLKMVDLVTHIVESDAFRSYKPLQ